MVTGRKIERSDKQKAIREKLDGVEFELALPYAIKRMFGFTHRAKDAKALWARSQCVWLGRSTFMHWSMSEDFDIPWVVSKAKNAPRNKVKLCELVEAELTGYFAERLSKLPRKTTGNWLPLP